MKQFKILLLIAVSVVVLYACSPAGGNRTGHEYMPDMAHSIAYESNVYDYYYLNTWDSASIFKLKYLANPHLPVKGTIPRGYAGFEYLDPTKFSEEKDMLRGGNSPNAIAVPLNGHVPYHYADTDEDRARASEDIVNNPFPITDAALAKGKDLYTINCAICHGDKGDGNGYLVNTDENPNAKYPAQPANFLQDTFYNSNNGRFYHAIIYGKNVMGSYADKLNYEERWDVIHYIRSLEAKNKKLEYSASANTLNPAFGMSEKQFKLVASRQTDSAPTPGTTEQNMQQGQQKTDQSSGEQHSGGGGGGSHD